MEVSLATRLSLSLSLSLSVSRDRMTKETPPDQNGTPREQAGAGTHCERAAP